MGISSAPELYQRAMEDIFADMEGVEIVMDDLLIHAPTVESHNKILKRVLQKARDVNLRFNPKETKLCQNSVEYVGHVISDKGVRVSEDKVRAVVQMPVPTSIANVQTLLGMVTYTCKFLKDLSAVTEPLRQLIKESNNRGFTWHWDEMHQEAFDKLKKMMTSTPVLRSYSLNEPIIISCDASQSGLGCVLLQNDKPVAYASKALTNAEYAYAQIEKELLAIVFAMKKFHSYIYGRTDVTVETDHLPLIRIFEKPLHQIPLRLQKMKMRVQHYHFTLVAKRGTEIPVADALSRAYISDTDVDQWQVFTTSLTEVKTTASFTDTRLKQLKEETEKDIGLQKLKHVIQAGWPIRRDTDPEVKPYFDYQEEMAEIDGIIFKGERVVIPFSMQKELLEIIHESHLGMVNLSTLFQTHGPYNT